MDPLILSKQPWLGGSQWVRCKPGLAAQYPLASSTPQIHWAGWPGRALCDCTAGKGLLLLLIPGAKAGQMGFVLSQLGFLQFQLGFELCQQLWGVWSREQHLTQAACGRHWGWVQWEPARLLPCAPSGDVS